ncbi:phage baseplate assembly protein V [Paenacidovorax monticola]|uniref:Phage baseplate assembly protein V n=2 Tax=Paenacidovorax monticola TaxID=1926868 RepID=A0A7H0HG20_9BURK|nr:phage baseplate assembly protein V [Paenacidovorax monticola]
MLSRARAGTIKCMDRPVDQPESPFEILRRLENVARMGTIEEVRTTKPARCRVRCGEILTGWLPWVAGRAAGQNGAIWWPPVKGEQVLMLAPGGDLTNAMVMPGAFSDKNPQASENPDIFRMDLGGGAYFEHDAANGVLRMEAMASIHIMCMGSSITITENSITMAAGGGTLVLNGDGITVTPDVLAQGISLVNHVHPGVKQGGDRTEKPE